MGATKEKIARDCEKCDFHDYVYVDTFEEAMNLAVEMARAREMQCFCLRRVQAGACSRIMKYVEINLKRL